MSGQAERTLEQVEAEIDATAARLCALQHERDRLSPPKKPGPDELADMLAEYGLPGFLEYGFADAACLDDEFALADPVGVFALIEAANARVADIVEECVATIRAIPSGGRGMSDPLFDVVAVNIKTRAERFIAEAKSERTAEAIVNMAVTRRGVDEEFFDTRPHPYQLKQEGGK